MSHKTGAWLVRYALEQLPVKYTFGIPGVHNTELYDELGKSDKIEPVLVVHEAGAAFMADGISRTSDGIGCLVIVPAAGITHAMSGIGEAYLDGIPLLVISGGIRTDVGKRFQLHELDQVELVSSITKFAKKVERHEEIVPTIFEAYRTSVSGEPGPVFIEVPVNVQLFKGAVDNLPTYDLSPIMAQPADSEAYDRAAALIRSSKQAGFFVGWGAREATAQLTELAEMLDAPVSTTLQGLSVFPGTHPLHTGMGFGAHSVPAAENAFKDVDCVIAVGTRFAEIPTGSFGLEVPENLIHIDINPEVFDKNYPAKISIEADAQVALQSLAAALKSGEQTGPDKASNGSDNKMTGANGSTGQSEMQKQIARDKKAYYDEWSRHVNTRVNPYKFFQAVEERVDDSVITVVDDGNHTFLTEELYTVKRSKHLISPTDFNCMGYCVPAAIGAKLANPDKQVIGIVGDGAFLMTGLEILTAATHNLGIIYFVFYDGELSQISQGQEIPYNRKTCTILGNVQLKGIADATGAGYVVINNNDEIGTGLDEALRISAANQPVVVDVRIDYSKRTRFTLGVVKTVLGRFPMGDKVRFIGRALLRKVTG